MTLHLLPGTEPASVDPERWYRVRGSDLLKTSRQLEQALAERDKALAEWKALQDAVREALDSVVGDDA